MNEERWGSDGRRFNFVGNWQVKFIGDKPVITGKEKPWACIVGCTTEGKISMYVWAYGIENSGQYEDRAVAQLMLQEDRHILGAIGEVSCRSKDGGLGFEIKEIVGGNLSDTILTWLLKENEEA